MRWQQRQKRELTETHEAKKREEEAQRAARRKHDMPPKRTLPFEWDEMAKRLKTDGRWHRSAPRTLLRHLYQTPLPQPQAHRGSELEIISRTRVAESKQEAADNIRQNMESLNAFYTGTYRHPGRRALGTKNV